MNGPNPTGNFLSFIEEAYPPDQVVRWFVERGWSCSEIADGCFAVRLDDVELVISPGPPALHGGHQILIRGFLKDADGSRISTIIEAAAVSHRTRWGDLDGENWSGTSVSVHR